LEVGSTNKPNRNQVDGMPITSIRDITTSHTISMVGTLHSSLSHILVRDSVKEQMIEMRA